MGKTYIVDVPKDFRVDLDSFAKMKNVLQHIRKDSFNYNDDFLDRNGDVKRSKERLYKNGFISKSVADIINKAISNLREKNHSIEELGYQGDIDLYFPLSKLFKKAGFVVLSVRGDNATGGMIINLSTKDKNNILKRVKRWKNEFGK